MPERDRRRCASRVALTGASLARRRALRWLLLPAAQLAWPALARASVARVVSAVQHEVVKHHFGLLEPVLFAAGFMLQVMLGALLQVGSGNWLVAILAAVSILIATINIVGGFLVTRRMLAMFQKS